MTYLRFSFAYFMLEISYILRSCVILGILGQKCPQIIIVEDDENDCQDGFILNCKYFGTQKNSDIKIFGHMKYLKIEESHAFLRLM